MFKKFLITTLYIAIFFHSNIYAQTINIDQAILKSKKTHKIPIVYLHRDGCPYCEQLEEFTFDDDDVHNYMNENFNFIGINVSHKEDIVVYKDKKMKPREFAIAIGYNFFPTVLFLDQKAEIEHVSVGYVEEIDFLHTLKYIRDKNYDW